MKRSQSIRLILIGGLSTAALAGCSPKPSGSAENVYTNNFFVPGQGARLVVEQNGGTATAPPFLYTITKRSTKTAGDERWFCYEFTATGHLEAGDVTFHGEVALVKRGDTWFFHREK